jgi:hypothetical protein
MKPFANVLASIDVPHTSVMWLSCLRRKRFSSRLFGMKLNLIAILAGLTVLFAIPGANAASLLDNYTVVKLEYGENRVDFNNDGVPDLVVIGHRENFNAHDYDVISFYANEPGDEHRRLAIVPLFDQDKESVTLAAAGGADCRLHDFRLLRPKHGNQSLLVVADRKMSDSFFEDNTVTFSYFKLERNSTESVGWPYLYFKLAEVRQAKVKYCDVNEAFRAELGLGNYR